jgi:hypothetical protein
LAAITAGSASARFRPLQLSWPSPSGGFSPCRTKISVSTLCESCAPGVLFAVVVSCVVASVLLACGSGAQAQTSALTHAASIGASGMGRGRERFMLCVVFRMARDCEVA